MKKVIVLISLTLLVAYFFNTKSLNETNSDVDLAKLIEVSSAKASGIATVPCIDIENTGGAFRKRKCVPCTWEDLPLSSTGTCTVNYE
jgi:hypothetical protein